MLRRHTPPVPSLPWAAPLPLCRYQVGEGGGRPAAGRGAGFTPLPHFLEAPAFLVKQVLGLLRKVPGKPHLDEGSHMGLGGFPSPPVAEGKVWVWFWAGMGGCPPEPPCRDR